VLFSFLVAGFVRDSCEGYAFDSQRHRLPHGRVSITADCRIPNRERKRPVIWFCQIFMTFER
jgi:hypothetical protein